MSEKDYITFFFFLMKSAQEMKDKICIYMEKIAQVFLDDNDDIWNFNFYKYIHKFFYYCPNF